MGRSDEAPVTIRLALRGGPARTEIGLLAYQRDGLPAPVGGLSFIRLRIQLSYGLRH